MAHHQYHSIPNFGQVISFLLATGVGAGFAVGLESKRFVEEAYRLLSLLGIGDFWEWRSKTLKFFDIGNVATGILFIGFVSMAFVSILSSITLSHSPQPHPVESWQQSCFFNLSFSLFYMLFPCRGIKLNDILFSFFMLKQAYKYVFLIYINHKLPKLTRVMFMYRLYTCIKSYDLYWGLAG